MLLDSDKLLEAANLAKEQLARRNHFLAENPAIDAIYQFQQQLHTLLMHKSMNKDWCRKNIPLFLNKIEELKQSIFKPLVALQNFMEMER